MKQRIQKNTLLLILILSTGFSAYSQEDEIISLDLSLQEAIDYALENNYGVRNARLDIEAAKKEVWKTTAIGLPQANATVDYQHIPGTIPTLEFPSPDGSVQEVSLAVKNSATYNVQVSQLVFRGEYFVGLQASRTYLQLSKNSEEKSEIDIQATVSNSYYTILLLENSYAILESSLQNIEKSMKETKAMIDQGMMDDTDYDQLKITRNTLVNSLNSLDRQVEVSYLLMKINLGLSQEDQITLTDPVENVILAVEENELINQEFQVKENIDYRIIATQEEIAELNLKREKTMFLPSISAFYLYQDRSNAPDFDMTINHIIGVNVNIPILSSGQRLASVQQAKIELEKTQIQKQQVSENLFAAYEQARYDFQSAYERYLNMLESIELAEKVYDETLIKFKNGVSSSLDVTQANDQYLNTYSDYTQAVLEMLIAKTELKRALNNF
jgi:outer membrane protein TolC